ncbi:MAG: aminoacyl-tRNA hydrolase [Chloroflexota bacterium]|nr:aminoacyl-tRNA hydrolase [Chloroflexota bacterium]MDE2920350.1 aminoacyl-tRNA hydrolase [Chloroflexota bacterium]
MKRWMRRWRRQSSPSFSPCRLIVGLGNPGPAYAGTRHNLGFLVCDRLAALGTGRWRAARYRAEVWTGQIDGLGIALLKPQTFVNESGPAVRAALQTFGLEPSCLIVVHDDLDLAFARIRVRPEGGSGGHNGMRSIIRTLKTDQVARVKIGLGRPPAGVDPADHVLGRFTPAERPDANAALERAADAVRALLTADVDSTMQQFNQTDGAHRPA